MRACDKVIRIEGRLIRIARLEGDGFEFLENPDAALAGLCEAGVRIDLFTFTHKLPHTSPKYGYPMEWDNVAALPVSTFDHWWTRQINDKTRNMVRRAEKKDVSVRAVPFDDALVQGIYAIYNEPLIGQAVRSCADRHIPYLVFGKFHHGKKPPDSLADFKPYNVFQRIEVPRYYIPLTLAGRMAFCLGLHHRLAVRIPDPVLVQLRK